MRLQTLTMIFLITPTLSSQFTISLLANFSIRPWKFPDNRQLGITVAINNDTFVSGAPRLDYVVPDMGAAYTFHYNNSEWRQQQRLVCPHPWITDRGNFGNKVVMIKNYIVVGYSYDDTKIINTTDNSTIRVIHNTGSALIFKQTGNSKVSDSPWTLFDRFLPSRFEQDQKFGSSMAIVDIRGKIWVMIGGKTMGNVHFYGLDIGVTKFALSEVRNESASGSTSLYGTTIAVEGTTLVIGDPGYNNGTGAFFVYANSGTNWRLQGTPYSASDATIGMKFASSLSFLNDVVAVGGDFNKVYVFTRPATLYEQSAILTPTNPSTVSYRNCSVSIGNKGDVVVVGAWMNERVEVHSKNSSADTTYKFKQMIAPPNETGIGFGIDVAIGGNFTVVGANKRNGMEGILFVYEPTPPQAALASGNVFCSCQVSFGKIVGIVVGILVFNLF